MSAQKNAEKISATIGELQKAHENLVGFAAKNTGQKTEQSQKNTAQAEHNLGKLTAANANITQISQKITDTKTVANENSSVPRSRI